MVLEGPSEEVILQPRPERWAGAAKGGAGRIVQAEGTWSMNRMSQWVDVYMNEEEGVFCEKTGWEPGPSRCPPHMAHRPLRAFHTPVWCPPCQDSLPPPPSPAGPRRGLSKVTCSLVTVSIIGAPLIIITPHLPLRSPLSTFGYLFLARLLGLRHLSALTRD